jgi:hypothetical protein
MLSNSWAGVGASVIVVLDEVHDNEAMQKSNKKGEQN